jgi:hypothetical protein
MFPGEGRGPDSAAALDPGLRRGTVSGAPRRKKPRILPSENRSFSVYETPAFNAWTALRDGATCSEELW